MKRKEQVWENKPSETWERGVSREDIETGRVVREIACQLSRGTNERGKQSSDTTGQECRRRKTDNHPHEGQARDKGRRGGQTSGAPGEKHGRKVLEQAVRKKKVWQRDVYAPVRKVYS